MSQKKEFQSKLVNFNISSSSHPDKIQINHSNVVNKLNYPARKVLSANIKEKWSHLRNISFPELHVDGDVSVLIGADLRYLHVHNETFLGKKMTQ